MNFFQTIHMDLRILNSFDILCNQGDPFIGFLQGHKNFIQADLIHMAHVQYGGWQDSKHGRFRVEIFKLRNLIPRGQKLLPHQAAPWKYLRGLHYVPDNQGCR